MRPELVEAIRAVSPIVHIIEEHARLRRCGAQLVGRCPLHGDKTPSFYVHPGKQVFHCWGCQAGGDVFEFVKRLHQCSFREAVQYLAQRAGIPIEGFRPSRELLRKVAAVKAERAEKASFERYCNERIEAVSAKYRALSRAATHAEDCLRAGEPDPYVHNLAWDALQHFLSFGEQIEREGLLDLDVLRTAWEEHDHKAA